MTRQGTPATRVLAYPVQDQTSPGHEAHIGKLTETSVAIYVRDSTEPLIADVNERVMLGRSPDREQPGLLDLTRFEAYKSGVSRNHLALVRQNGKLYLHDVGSINGSWLNGQRLKPYELYSFPSGAVVFLGQLPLYIYY